MVQLLYITSYPPRSQEQQLVRKTHSDLVQQRLILSGMNEIYKEAQVSSGQILLPNELWKIFQYSELFGFQNCRLLIYNNTRGDDK